MATNEQKKNILSIAFLNAGAQYYAIARYCAPFFYAPVSMTMFHHAIEMLMKGYLIKTHPVSTLRNQKTYGHNLDALWTLYKSTIEDESLSRFDKSVSDLNQVEKLRYPDNMDENGFIVSVSIREPSPLQFSDVENIDDSGMMSCLNFDNKPQYLINVSNLDKIVLSIFDACEVNPKQAFKDAPVEFMSNFPPEFKFENE